MKKKFAALSLLLLVSLTSCAIPNQASTEQPPNNGDAPSLPETWPEFPAGTFSTKSAAKTGWFLYNNRWIYYAGITARNGFRDYYMVYIQGMGWVWGPTGCEQLGFGC